jgi:hypothetical protein
MAPGSLHPTYALCSCGERERGRYRWAATGEPSELPRETLDVLAPPKRERAAPAPRPGLNGSASNGYARAALEREVEAVRAAPHGTRNDQLNRSAFNLGQLVAGGELDRAEVEDALTAAALDNGDGGGDTERRKIAGTIRSGLESGAASPRTRPLPAPRPGPVAPAATADGDGAGTGKVEVPVPGSHRLGAEDSDYFEVGADEFGREGLAAIPEGRLYRRAGEIVEVRDGRVHAVKPDRMRGIVDECARLYAGVEAKEPNDDGSPCYVKAFKPCGRDHAALILAHAASVGDVRELDSVTTAPTLLPDGSILVEGYDAGTRTLCIPAHVYPPVPENPTDEDARNAFAEVLAPFAEFPLESDADRAALAAYMLTLAARPAIDGPCPGFVSTSHDFGDGKGLLIEAATLAMTGELPEMMGPPGGRSADAEAEIRKRVLGSLLSGARAVLTDNIPDGSTLRSPTLAALLTLRRLTDRPLGATAQVTVPVRAVFSWSGANLALWGDMARRCLSMLIVPGVENPAARTFKIDDLRAYVRQHHPRLLVAALTVLRSYGMVRRPRHGGPRLGSFESWDDRVRGCVVWATSVAGWPAEPLAVQDRHRAESPDRESLVALHTAWASAFGTRRVTAREIVQVSTTSPDLAAAVSGIGGTDKSGRACAKALGQALRSRMGRIVGGRSIQREDGTAHGGSARWRLAYRGVPTGPSEGPTTSAASGDSANAKAEGPEGLGGTLGEINARPGARTRARA